MKLLHTSDWHLGRYFHQQSLLSDQAHVLEQIIQIATAEAVDAVIIAGDIYDRSLPPAEAVRLLDETLHRLISDHDIPVIMISGNHDGPDRLGFAARQLRESGLTIVSSFDAMREPVVLADEHGKVAVWCMPYNDPAHVADFFKETIKDYQTAHERLVQDIEEQTQALGLQDARHVLVSHCYLDGANESDSERPLSIGGADRVDAAAFRNFDYVALGHLHQPQYKGEEWIRYSGSILKYSFSEHQQKKSVTLVDMDKQGFAGVRLIPLKAQRDVRILTGTFNELLVAGAKDSAAEDYILAEMTDTEVVLDAFSRLRQVYPNLMDLTKTRFQSAERAEVMSAQKHLERTEVDMLTDFYKQVTGTDLSAAQLEIAADVIASVQQQVEDEQ